MSCPTTARMLVPDLAEQALSLLTDHFETKTEHQPSGDMYDALDDLLWCLEGMASDDGLLPSYYLSPLDCGVGKTTAIAMFLRVLVRSPLHRNVGVLLCIPRLEEIRAVASLAGLSPDDFATYTSSPEINSLGRGKEEASKARVLFTTHAMVESRIEGRNFGAVSEFHFEGHPRQVRIWDEALLPGRTITVGRDDILSLIKPLRPVLPKVADLLDTLSQDLLEKADGTAVALPDFESTLGVDLDALLGALDGCPPDVHASATGLWLLSGKKATLRTDGAFGTTALSYENHLPNDFMPVLITDASGRVRTSYRQWREQRKTLTLLHGANKRYENLRVGLWERGGGKSSFSKSRYELAEGIAKLINSKPDEDWLVVHHKANRRFDTKQDVLNLVEGDKERVKFCSWGSHQATNDFVEIENVVLAGTLFYRDSYVEALARLGSDIEPGRPISESLISEVAIGEQRNLILQAVNRTAARKCQGDQCHPCRAYIIAAKRSGIRDALPEVFPGCRVEDWNPRSVSLGQRQEQALSYLDRRFADDPDALVTFAEVQEASGVSDRANFHRSIKRNDAFLAALGRRGIVEHGPQVRPKGYRQAASVHGFRFDEPSPAASPTATTH